MNGSTGFDVVRRIRQKGYSGRLVMYLDEGIADQVVLDRLRVRAQEAGADDFYAVFNLFESARLCADLDGLL